MAFQPHAERPGRQALALRKSEEFGELSLQFTLPLFDTMALGILWSAEKQPRRGQPWRVATDTGAVSSESPKKSWRQNVWRASRKNCNFTYSTYTHFGI